MQETNRARYKCKTSLLKAKQEFLYLMSAFISFTTGAAAKRSTDTNVCYGQRGMLDPKQLRSLTFH